MSTSSNKKPLLILEFQKGSKIDVPDDMNYPMARPLQELLKYPEDRMDSSAIVKKSFQIIIQEVFK